MACNYSLDSFCPEAWSQIEIDAEGDFKICCLANFDKDFGMAVDENGQVMNIMTHTIVEAMNSATHKQHRYEMSQNQKPKRCRSCFDSEEATKDVGEFKERSRYGLSKRQRVIQNTSRAVPEYIKYDQAQNVTLEDGTLINPKIVNLDIRFGNLCNQKCIMCSPQHSNLWYDDWAAIGYGPPQYNRDENTYKKGKFKEYPLVEDKDGRVKMQGLVNWWETDTWWKKFDKIAPQLRYIYFTGGEPLIVPAMQECLDRLIEKGHANDIQLRYDTNLSVINNKVIDKWKHFKNVFLCISVDDTEDRYNTIRFPGNFERILQNIYTLKENNINIHYISACVGIASPYSILRIAELAEKLKVNTYFRFLEGPDWLDIRNYPASAKLEIIENLNKHIGHSQTYDKWAKAEIKLLEKYMNHSEEKHLKEFIRVMNILDKQRNTNWKTSLPDVVELFQKHTNLLLN
jgi:pyruvate-formate lyase-activating enzyme